MITSFKMKLKRLRNYLDRRVATKGRVNQIAFMSILSAVLFTLVLLGMMPERIDVRVGDIAKEEIRATKEIVDEVTTEKYRLEAMESVEPRYRIDASIQIRVKNDIRRFFETLSNAQKELPENRESAIKMISEQDYVGLEPSELQVLLDSRPELLLTLESSIYEIVNQIMNIGATQEDIDYSKGNVESTFAGIGELDDSLKRIGPKIVNEKIVPNKFLDIETTNKEKEKAAEEVDPVVIKEGEIIVNRNEIVDQQSYELLKESGLLKEARKINYGLILGAIMITAAIEVVFGLYIYYFEKKVYEDRKLMVVIFIVAILVLLVSKSLSAVSGYLMPVATSSILLAILINARVSLLVNVLIGVLLGITESLDTSVMTMVFIGGMIGSFSSINTQQRSNIMTIGVAVALFNLISIAGFGIAGETEIKLLLTRMAYGTANGLLSAVLAIGSMPIWENIFGVLTPIKLLELMNPNQPLLKRLLTEAPGTYYHSILVGNLSENAAEAVGASSLLVRAGSYYHDIGKLKRPYFFKENQIGMENPHDKISANMSAVIITNHAKDGLEVAEDQPLPKEIKDIMLEHHGTTLVSFFYHKAMNEEGVNPNTVIESKFRYGGPRPQSKESAIVMLADSVEAAVRSIKEPSKEKISRMICNIVKGKMEDGQLDESGLTLKDISNIEKSFADTLLGIYHERIEYPSLDIAEIKEAK
ncbi:7TM-HD extracellular [Andreesenia angusta]|uniref:7TM-HD extracellular n=2 Tax=Andreesenia angusta TaxID=39480 RepID=A0A1S1V7I7_9FIRM|nr:7TM-HD extracellular [Andreesenia angusta]